MSLRFNESASGVTFAVRVQPRARRNAVAGVKGDALKVCVTAPPEDGRANEAVIELLAETFGVKQRQVAIIAGATSRDKVVRVSGLTRAELAVKL
ncbi:MAG: YggU family protein [Verrucomicrobia bacterium]|nr:YggU family protein [Verrucomicrobiota bacterium]